MHRYFEAASRDAGRCAEGGGAAHVLERRARGAERQDLRRDGQGRCGGRVQGAARQAVRNRPSGSRAPRQGGEPVGLSARHHLSGRVHRRARGGVAGGGRRLGGGRHRGTRRRVPRDHRSPEQAELCHRQRRAAHVRPAVRDGVPGGWPACAGPGAGGRRLRLCGNDQGAGAARAGRSRRAAGRSRCAWTSSGASCRAASP